jgi:hypothetical protein
MTSRIPDDRSRLLHVHISVVRFLGAYVLILFSRSIGKKLNNDVAVGKIEALLVKSIGFDGPSKVRYSI